MDKQITAQEAWTDFWLWIKRQEKWKRMPRNDKQYLYKADKARRDGELGYDRIKKLLTRHAPERYQFRESIVLIEK